MNERQYNGATHDLTDEEQEMLELINRDTARIASRTPAPITVSEATAPSTFEQQAHTLMLESVDRLSQGWIEQLKYIVDHAQALEKRVLQACAREKHNLTALHLLGAQVMKKVEGDAQFCEQLDKELDKIMHETRVA